jgi:hypothetical protein
MLSCALARPPSNWWCCIFGGEVLCAQSIGLLGRRVGDRLLCLCGGTRVDIANGLRRSVRCGGCLWCCYTHQIQTFCQPSALNHNTFSHKHHVKLRHLRYSTSCLCSGTHTLQLSLNCARMIQNHYKTEKADMGTLLTCKQKTMAHLHSFGHMCANITVLVICKIQRL